MMKNATSFRSRSGLPVLPPFKSRIVLLAGALALTGAYSNVSGQVVTADNYNIPATGVTVVAVGQSATTAGGVGTGTVTGYLFPDAGSSGSGALSSLPSFISGDNFTPAPAPGSRASNPFNIGQVSLSSYSALTIGTDALVQTGVEYINPVPFTTTDGATVYPYNIFDTFTLGGTVPLSFEVGVLEGNSDTNTNNSLLEVELLNGSTVEGSALLNSSYDANSASNDFYDASISGAASGETVEVLATNPANPGQSATVGGVTFYSVISAPSVPEPSTFALGMAGFLALLSLAVRHRKSA